MSLAPDSLPPETSITVVGNATVLLRCVGMTVLTDPNFLHAGQHAYLGYGLRSRRLVEPALGVADLPPLDAVLLSHVHGDHWDREARRGLDREVTVLTTPSSARRLHRQGFAAAEGLRPWTSRTLTRGRGSLTVTAIPGRHGPVPVNVLLPAVMGSMADFAWDGELVLRLYITGDTLIVPALHEVARRWHDLDVVMVHLGGTTLPGGLVVTLDGRGGADLVEIVKPDLVVPVHHEDYDVFRSPLPDFLAEMAGRGDPAPVLVPVRGEPAPLPTRGGTAAAPSV